MWHEAAVILSAIFSIKKRQKDKIFDHYKKIKFLKVKIAHVHQHLSMRSTPNMLWDPFHLQQLKVNKDRAHRSYLTTKEMQKGS